MTSRLSCRHCLRPARAKGLCKRHEHQVRTHGRPLSEGDIRRRFWAKVDIRGPDDCWPWKRSCDSKGYGYVRIDGVGRLAHRVAYEYLVGPIPEGRELDHQCHTPDCILGVECPHRRCCNPHHLKPTTTGENSSNDRSARAAVLIARAKTITHCPNGHEYTPENTIIDSRGWRLCRTCRRA